MNLFNLSRRRKKLGRWLGITFALGTVACLSAMTGAIIAVSLVAKKPLQQVQLTPEQEAWFNGEEAVSLASQLNRPINVVVLGVKVLTSDLDEPPAEDLGYHALVDTFDGVSDTMLLLRFDPEQEKLIVLSIPRDTKVEIPDHGTAKINAANDYGGPVLASQTISELLGGITIDRYVRINIQGLEKLIDALGGVTVDVPRDMKYTDESQHLYIDLKQGRQHLNGAKAMQFLRFRYDAYGDIGRIQRQQILMRAVLEKVINPNLIFKSPEIMGIIKNHLDTNLSVEELIALTAFGAQTKGFNIQMLMLPGEFSGDGKEAISYWLPNSEGINTMMAEHFGLGYREAEYTKPERLRIAIQDSTSNPEAVTALILKLKQAGYSRIHSYDAAPEPLRVTKIIAQNGDDVSAIALRATLGMGEVLVESTGVLGSDVTIVIGQDWQLSNFNTPSPEQLVSF